MWFKSLFASKSAQVATVLERNRKSSGERNVAWRCVTRGHGVKDNLNCNHVTDRCHLKSITKTHISILRKFVPCMRHVLCQPRTKNEIPLYKKKKWSAKMEKICDSVLDVSAVFCSVWSWTKMISECFYGLHAERAETSPSAEQFISVRNSLLSQKNLNFKASWIRCRFVVHSLSPEQFDCKIRQSTSTLEATGQSEWEKKRVFGTRWYLQNLKNL